MVKSIAKDDKQLFRCEECDMIYETQELAERCEKFCRENKACNIEVTKHAVGNSEDITKL